MASANFASKAPVEDEIMDVLTLTGGCIVTSFPALTKEFFRPFDEAKGVETSVRFVGGSVEAACGLGLADAVVDLVETGTTMRVRIDVFIIYWCWKAQSNRFQLFSFTGRLLDSRLFMAFLRLRLSLFPTKIPSMLIL